MMIGSCCLAVSIKLFNHKLMYKSLEYFYVTRTLNFRCNPGFLLLFLFASGAGRKLVYPAEFVSTLHSLLSHFSSLFSDGDILQFSIRVVVCLLGGKRAKEAPKSATK